MTTRKLLENGAVCAAILIFSGLLVKEWLAVKEADAITAKTGQPQNAPASGPFAGLSEVFNFHPMYAQEQFFARWATPGLYAPDPRIEQLDLDDLVVQGNYRRDADTFTKRLKELNIDINTVLVRPDPVNIRLLALQEGNPATVWTLYLLTGDDTAQQLQDGIHLRRRGVADKIVGWPVEEKDTRNHSERSTVLWRPNGRGGWTVDPSGSNYIFRISTSTIHEIKKHQDLGPRYQLDCDALRKFAQPLPPSETTRELTLKVDIPVSPSFHAIPGAGNSPCTVRLDSPAPEHATEPPLRSTNAPPPLTRKPDEPGAEVVTAVDARRMWTSTGITVARGQIIQIRATGTVTGATSRRDAAFRLVGPAGWGLEPQFVSRRYNLVLGHGSSYMCLVAKIGEDGEPFNAGSTTPMNFTSSTSGTLYFGVNDALAPNDPELYFRDNGGSFKVTVTTVQSH